MSRLVAMNVSKDAKPSAPDMPAAAAASTSPPSSPSYPQVGECKTCEMLRSRIEQLEGQLLKKSPRKRIVLLSTHGFDDDMLDVGRAQKLNIIQFNSKVHVGKKFSDVDADILCIDLSKDADLEFYRLIKPTLPDDVDVVLLCKKSEKISDKQTQSWGYTHRVKKMPDVAESPEDYVFQLIADSLVRVKSPIQKLGRIAKKLVC